MKLLAETIDDFIIFIIGHVIDKESWLIAVANSLSGHEVRFVGIVAPIDVINIRRLILRN